MAYKGLEYASPVWDPHGIVVQEELEQVQNHAARIVIGNYNFETGSMISILEQLGWESLHKRCKGSKLIGSVYSSGIGRISSETNCPVPDK